jgi:signal transduction histidine kinase
VNVVSHELRTPLTTVKGYLQLLEKMEDRQPNKLFVEKSLHSINKLEDLIKDLLDVSRIQRGEMKFDIKQFSIDEVIDEAIASMKMIFPSHEVVKKNDFKREIIQGDKQRIEQVVSNLLSNAIKYSPGENKVILECNKVSKHLVVRIRDYGIGISKEEHDKIFERFYRSRDAATMPGFGLGLYICRDIVTRHNGKIWVEPEDKGTSFSFSIPLISSALNGNPAEPVPMHES